MEKDKVQQNIFKSNKKKRYARMQTSANYISK